jgi:hypothetical protein
VKSALLLLASAAWLLTAHGAAAQAAPLPQQAIPQQPILQQAIPQQPVPQVAAASYPPQPYAYAASPSNQRSASEITALYISAAAYGVGMGLWLGAEAKIKDPGLFLIAPAILGVAAPAGVYALDNPALPRGLPAAIASGLVIGAGEGLGIASYQFVHARAADEWGIRGFSRATAIGATLGGAGGLLLGYLQEPSPKSSLLTTSGVVWGAAIGSMYGYGASGKGLGYGRANDSASLGGLTGFNVGLVAAAALSTVYIPSYRALSYMWAGAGVGAAVSLPVYFAYAGKNSPPAKRGLVLTGTTTALGIVAGALLAGTGADSADSAPSSHFAYLDYLLPIPSSNGATLAVGGRLE